MLYSLTGLRFSLLQKQRCRELNVGGIYGAISFQSAAKAEVSRTEPKDSMSAVSSFSLLQKQRCRELGLKLGT